MAEAPTGVPTIEDVLAAWNGPRNAVTRTATRPPQGPIGPFAVIGAGKGLTASPRGGYEVRVGVSPGRGPISGPTVHPCLVVFWYRSGYEGGPATIVFSSLPGDGAFELGETRMYFGINTDHRGSPRALQHTDGRLSLAESPPP